jgi:hypothetical protein
MRTAALEDEATEKIPDFKIMGGSALGPHED